MLQTVSQFSGMLTEDPHLHLRLFMKQLDDEPLYEAMGRFKELLCKCPYHGIPKCIQLETFYNVLNAHTRMVVDAFANGALLSKSASKNYQWSTNQAASGR
ncbi:Retrotransposon gag protein [Gossypium australe]|uniref:Retrotransposon gag protein n=1 Tax=Gossypium australe TaxID=47621 RepID=A0A5B6WRL7_9ROSI|nr:Retrotransposon gag protein [Gossypium australe]